MSECKVCFEPISEHAKLMPWGAFGYCSEDCKRKDEEFWANWHQ